MFPTLSYASSAVEACDGAHVVLHLTEWREFRDLDPADLAPAPGQPVLIDARNALDLERWRKAGWAARAMGRPNA